MSEGECRYCNSSNIGCIAKDSDGKQYCAYCGRELDGLTLLGDLMVRCVKDLKGENFEQ